MRRILGRALCGVLVALSPIAAQEQPATYAVAVWDARCLSIGKDTRLEAPMEHEAPNLGKSKVYLLSVKKNCYHIEIRREK